MSMLSQKSDDGPHIAVKTQCNNTPNGSPQYTQVPLHEWAVFIYHQAAICVSFLCPIPSLRSVTSEDSCNIPSCFHMALQGIYSCQQHCDVVWTDTTDLLKCFIYCTISDSNYKLLTYQDSNITHTLCCMSAITTQPLPGGPSTWSNNTSTAAAFKRAPLSPTRQGPLILVSSMGLTHPHNSGFNFMCAGS